MPDILHLMQIDAPPERVFAAIATEEGVRNWWTRDADLEPAAGGAGAFRFHGGARFTRVRVDELTPPGRVGWTVTESNVPGGWPGTRIGFELLRAEAGGTVVAFAHRGFAEADDDYARVSTGWAWFLISLRQLVETGTGSPYPDVDFCRLRC